MEFWKTTIQEFDLFSGFPVWLSILHYLFIFAACHSTPSPKTGGVEKKKAVIFVRMRRLCSFQLSSWGKLPRSHVIYDILGKLDLI